MNSRFGRRLAAAVVGLAILTAACGSDSKSSSTSAPSASADAAELCSARDALKTSIAGLADVDLVKNGTAGVEAALTTIKDDLAAVKAAASADLKPQITAFEDAVDALGTSVKDIGSAGVTAVVTAATAVATTGATLVTSLEAVKCS